MNQIKRTKAKSLHFREKLRSLNMCLPTRNPRIWEALELRSINYRSL